MSARIARALKNSQAAASFLEAQAAESAAARAKMAQRQARNPAERSSAPPNLERLGSPSQAAMQAQEDALREAAREAGPREELSPREFTPEQQQEHLREWERLRQAEKAPRRPPNVLPSTRFSDEMGWNPKPPPEGEGEPLARSVIERGRSGRPNRTEPLPIGNENAILEEGARRIAPQEPRPPSNNVNDRMREMLASGMNQSAIARELGITRQAVSLRFKAMRENPEGRASDELVPLFRKGPRKWTAEYGMPGSPRWMAEFGDENTARFLNEREREQRRVWPDERIARLRELVAQRKTYAQIAEEIGGTAAGAKQKTLALGLEKPSPIERAQPAGSIWTDDAVDKLLDLHGQKKTFGEIAEALKRDIPGITRNHVAGKLKRLNLGSVSGKQTGSQPWSDEEITFLRNARREGKSWSQIAAMMPGRAVRAKYVTIGEKRAEPGLPQVKSLHGAAGEFTDAELAQLQKMLGYRRGGRIPGELPAARKASHEEVGYQAQSPRTKQRCELCNKFIPAEQGGPACKKVVQPIGPGAWCRRFVKAGSDAPTTSLSAPALSTVTGPW
jgi:hypothetical protein